MSHTTEIKLHYEFRLRDSYAVLEVVRRVPRFSWDEPEVNWEWPEITSRDTLKTLEKKRFPSLHGGFEVHGGQVYGGYPYSSDRITIGNHQFHYYTGSIWSLVKTILRFRKDETPTHKGIDEKVRQFFSRTE